MDVLLHEQTGAIKWLLWIFIYLMTQEMLAKLTSLMAVHLQKTTGVKEYMDGANWLQLLLAFELVFAPCVEKYLPEALLAARYLRDIMLIVGIDVGNENYSTRQLTLALYACALGLWCVCKDLHDRNLLNKEFPLYLHVIVAHVARMFEQYDARAASCQQFEGIFKGTGRILRYQTNNKDYLDSTIVINEELSANRKAQYPDEGSRNRPDMTSVAYEYRHEPGNELTDISIPKYMDDNNNLRFKITGKQPPALKLPDGEELMYPSENALEAATCDRPSIEELRERYMSGDTFEDLQPGRYCKALRTFFKSHFGGEPSPQVIAAFQELRKKRAEAAGASQPGAGGGTGDGLAAALGMGAAGRRWRLCPAVHHPAA